MRIPFLTSTLLTGVAAFALTLPASAEEFEVAGLTFSSPKALKKVDPSSPMRKAQFEVGEGDQKGEVTFFHFGAGLAGGKEANIKRWFGMFKEPREELKPKTEETKAGEVPVTFVSAQGTYLSGPPRGPKVPKPGYALLAAIVEGKDGAVYVRFTGPQKTVAGATEAFKKMITAAK